MFGLKVKVLSVLLSPSALLTITGTAPTVLVVSARTGVITVSCVSLTIAKLVPAIPPNKTSVAPVKPEPEIVTVVPPLAVPLAGEREVTTGKLGVEPKAAEVGIINNKITLKLIIRF